ncbi:MAG: hypothetical protein KDJ52_28690 [Anaerolineae bacterium]|nr:hypothetical protein [Anaerolineae bacterium]
MISGNKDQPGKLYSTQRVIDQIQSDLNRVEKNTALYKETNFGSRSKAIDYLEFNIIDRIEGLLHTVNQPEELAQLKHAAEGIKGHLEEIDTRLFQQIRADIQAGVCSGTALKDRIDDYVGRDALERSQQNEIGYDSLDTFINGLLLIEPIPLETKTREPEMVYYQQTPARIILELVEKAQLTAEDVFYDLGSGLGQVALLVNLLSDAAVKGIEFEPAYCDYARACAVALNLSGIEFIEIDARQVNYADGTVFFMYTPFEGSMLQAVLEKLQQESQQRMIRLFTYGPCTPQVSQQSWLQNVDSSGNDTYKLGIFRSL